MEITAKKEDEGKLIETLQSSDAPAFDKDVACRQLAVIGTAKSVPALAAMLEDENLNDVARHALGEIPDTSVDEALRAALKKVKGRRLVAVVNTIGNRRDRDATEALVGLLGDGDAQVVNEAATSLAKIGGRDAGMALQQALESDREEVREAAGDALITVSDNLMKRDMGEIAARVFDRTRQAKVSRPIQVAATRGAVLARGDEGMAMLVDLLKGEEFDMFNLGLWITREMPGATVAKAVQPVVAGLPEERQALLKKAIADRK